jgi:hypothetical protein
MITFKDTNSGKTFRNIGVGELFYFPKDDLSLCYKFSNSQAVTIVFGDEELCTIVGGPFDMDLDAIVVKVGITGIELKRLS